MRLSQKHIRLFAAVAFASLAISALAQSGKPSGLKTICIDPGHGGKDPGCISKDGKNVKEKDIALGIALKIKKLINDKDPSVNVVMTREKDTYPALDKRAKTANKEEADLFISIHVNSVDTKKNKNWKTVHGFSIHTLGQSSKRDLFSANMDLCRRENSVILQEDDYTTKYQGFDPDNPESYIIFNLMQNTNLQQSLSFAEDLNTSLLKGPIKHSRGISQDPFLVLWMTTMPSVLLECGFITSQSDLDVMKSEEGQQGIADAVAEAFFLFKERYDRSVLGESAGESKKEEEPSKEAAPQDSVLYGTQVLASSRKIGSDDPVFKGYTATSVISGNLFKYIIGTSADKSAAQAEYEKIKKIFPESFLVEISGGQAKRLSK